MKGFVQAIHDGEKGMIFKNSVYLPFHLELLSVWIGKEMSLLAVPDLLTDFSDGNGHLAIREGEQYTNIVFRKGGDLRKELGRSKGHIILNAAEKGSNIFDEENRHYIKICFANRHILDFELIEDPFYL
ncbi:MULTISPECIES: hypothetical protein [Prosthecochloris]|uniref:Uncharacterized protein n=1 Tax=Prosthecochloris marina TaxID=2017681 RepID=A0A317TAE6_9CHLB|nr:MULTISPECIES: hypothetical protein [Prosthecochloris]PWW82601.1 hypothetical protein CR164_02270 [Prosthecochloris marina]UZJ38121.1 hypothetical protein OO005_02645 [Prosthecochloris sp. SCSIO W1103]UZJ41922.1 hypothetical protein OO006_02685 [Prosthecochloris sp. SCSIO W1101]